MRILIQILLVGLIAGWVASYFVQRSQQEKDPPTPSAAAPAQAARAQEAPAQAAGAASGSVAGASKASARPRGATSTQPRIERDGDRVTITNIPDDPDQARIERGDDGEIIIRNGPSLP